MEFLAIQKARHGTKEKVAKMVIQSILTTLFNLTLITLINSCIVFLEGGLFFNPHVISHPLFCNP